MTDGIDCINVYSKGQTELGRLLSNFAHTPFECIDGHFESIEGYWYWLSCRDDALRTMYGYQAKMYGRKARERNPFPITKEEHISRINLAIVDKIIASSKIIELLKASTLPFVHYYVWNDRIDLKDDGSGSDMKWLEQCRTTVKGLQV